MRIVKALASVGAFVLVNGRNQQRLKDIVASVTSTGGQASPLELDITDEAAVKKAFNEIRDKHGHLDILILLRSCCRFLIELFSIQLESAKHH
ncbi:SDR family NAD(P)-dependent oxidoreductase [Aetokthonos hydrillicola]|jgi:gluconate 5-dehydrogenase|uniref:SDR family NAD(P)-dependent oxidoreductase n=1 Tax=Aetokthonos hydrillicola TaxID=1550245 RepID=UPI001ABAB327|nr:SDR family NAD(P)-dependent oxidoreductase [Aetokthonos hydrillicola CCALA 1050]MBW4585144.1 SDR family NAD(P)-dependent oxidoreductase [Aetokthonos hydrillicola CCALA 1050]